MRTTLRADWDLFAVAGDHLRQTFMTEDVAARLDHSRVDHHIHTKGTRDMIQLIVRDGFPLVVTDSSTGHRSGQRSSDMRRSRGG